MYAPNNINVYLAAFAGAQAGMAVNQAAPTDPTAADYAAVSSVAQAFSQALDTAWGANPANSLQVALAGYLSESYWSNKSVSPTAQFTLPATHAVAAGAIVAIVTAGENSVTGQGITPPPPVTGTSVAGIGYWHNTVANNLDANASHGSVPGQVPICNPGVTDAPFTTITGDGQLSGLGAWLNTAIQNVAVSAAQALNLVALYLGAWGATVLAGPVTLTKAAPFKAYNATGGNIQFNTPAPSDLFDGMVIGLKAAVASAAQATLKANNAGESVEDPGNSGHYVTNPGSVGCGGQGPMLKWKYRASDQTWIGWTGV